MNIVVLTTEQNFVWTSMQEIIPGIVETWSYRDNVEVINVDNLNLNAHSKIFMKADVLVVTAFNLDIHKALKVANEVFLFSGRTYFYLHNFSTIGCWPLFKWNALNYFKDGDVFVSSCERDKNLLEQVFPKVNCLKIPFLMNLKSDVKKIESSDEDPFVFVGRISRQKNLHQLIIGYSQYLKKTGSKRKLIFFGKEDNLGSPNMGKESKDYLKSLEELVKDFDLNEQVEFRGFVQRDEIYRELNKSDYIFLTPTLHSDENFGMAAFRSLIDGKRSLLSDWGGHPDYKEHFPGQISYLKVEESNWGPVITIDEISNKLEEVTSKESVEPHLPIYYHFDSIKKALDESLNLAVDATPLTSSELAQKVFESRESFTESGQENLNTKIFADYEDELVKPFFSAYGMFTKANKSVFKKGKYNAFPWVKKVGSKVEIRDPHKGFKSLNYSEGPANTSLGNLSYELTEELLGYNALYMDGTTELSGKLFPDKCQTSISLLKEKVILYFKENNLGEPQFADDYLNFKNSDSELENIVLFGGYVNRLLESGTWPYKKMRLWVISTAVRNTLVQLFNLKEEQIGVIPRYALYGKTDPAQIPKLEDAEFIYAGRLSRVKNIELLIRTVNELQKLLKSPVKLKLVGDFDEDSHDYAGVFTKKDFKIEVMELVGSLKWEVEPEFIEKQAFDEWPNLFNKNSVYISPSTYLSEDFAVSIAQAQEKAIPVVASDWGGHQDLQGQVLKLSTNRLLPLGEEELLAAELAKYLKENWFNSSSEGVISQDGKVPQEILISELDEIRREFCQKYGSQVLGLTKGMGAHFAESDEGKLLYNKWVKSLGKMDSIDTWVVLKKGHKYAIQDYLQGEKSFGLLHSTDLTVGDNLKRLCLAEKVILLLEKEEGKKIESLLKNMMGESRVLTPLSD